MIWLIVAPFVGLIIWGIIADMRNNYSVDTGVLYGFGIAFLVLSILILSIYTIDNYNGLAKWKAFYETNNTNYAITIDKTASYLSSDKFVSGALVEGSIEKVQLGPAISDRIKEWRDAVNDYNTTIASLKFFDSNIWTGVMVPDEVQNMKLLVIK
jgi:hypothetical protein